MVSGIWFQLEFKPAEFDPEVSFLFDVEKEDSGGKEKLNCKFYVSQSSHSEKET